MLKIKQIQNTYNHAENQTNTKYIYHKISPWGACGRWFESSHPDW